MLTVSIQGKFEEARDAIRAANKRAECLEFRIDLMEKQDLQHLSKLRKEAKLPVIFTLRNKAHGGAFAGNEREREEKFLELLSLNPDYIDLEWDAPFFLEYTTIVSYHNFEETPENLEEILKKMEARRGAFYKLATYAHTSIDALRMLSLVSKERNVAGMCLGEKGEITRILAPIVDAPFTYCYWDKESAPGQLSLDTLQSLYRFDTLNRSTKIYALIGNPVCHSIGHLVHNHHYQKEAYDGVYVKIALHEEELPCFFNLIKDLPFCGISVTMPLKEKVGPFLDAIDPESRKIGAINTLIRQGDEWHGLNTDGKGALDALEKKGKIAEKVVLILGAGGAAKAIAYEVKQRGGKVVIANRSLEKGKRLAAQVEGSAISLEEVDACPYEVIINTTPVGMGGNIGKTPISKEQIRDNCLALDVIISPRETLFLAFVQEKGGNVADGTEMFGEQALRQLKAWSIPITNEEVFLSSVEPLSLD